MTPMEQVKARIESMRKTNPDSNQLCKLLDMVEGFVKEERLAQEKPTAGPTDELVRVLKYLNACGGLGFDKHEMISKALFHYENSRPTPAKQEDGLVEELREWSREYGLSCEPEIEDMTKAYEAFNKILTLRKRSE